MRVSLRQNVQRFVSSYRGTEHKPDPKQIETLRDDFTVDILSLASMEVDTNDAIPVAFDVAPAVRERDICGVLLIYSCTGPEAVPECACTA